MFTKETIQVCGTLNQYLEITVTQILMMVSLIMPKLKEGFIL